MISLINILDEMKNDYSKELYSSSKVITRQFAFSTGSKVNINLYKLDDACEISFLLPSDVDTDSFRKIPSWKGMEIHYLSSADNYLEFKQVGNYDRRIFVQVMQDVIDAVELAGLSRTIFSVIDVLSKWSSFFKRNEQTTLSEIEQQGLYGELCVFEKLLKSRNDVVACWTGCMKETHDYYTDANAIEVKTSCKSGPDIIKVSNEYQLDDSDVDSRLYLVFLKKKRSEADGEKLPAIVKRIHEKLTEDQREKFEDKLLKAGYIYKMPELYTYAFRVRNERFFEVKEGFPRIIALNLDNGIGAVEYELSLDACTGYEVSEDVFIKELLHNGNRSNAAVQ